MSRVWMWSQSYLPPGFLVSIYNSDLNFLFWWLIDHLLTGSSCLRMAHYSWSISLQSFVLVDQTVRLSQMSRSRTPLAYDKIYCVEINFSLNCTEKLMYHIIVEAIDHLLTFRVPRFTFLTTYLTGKMNLQISVEHFRKKNKDRQPHKPTMFDEQFIRVITPVSFASKCSPVTGWPW